MENSPDRDGVGGLTCDEFKTIVLGGFTLDELERQEDELWKAVRSRRRSFAVVFWILLAAFGALMLIYGTPDPMEIFAVLVAFAAHLQAAECSVSTVTAKALEIRAKAATAAFLEMRHFDPWK